MRALPLPPAHSLARPKCGFATPPALQEIVVLDERIAGLQELMRQLEAELASLHDANLVVLAGGSSRAGTEPCLEAASQAALADRPGYGWQRPALARMGAPRVMPCVLFPHVGGFLQTRGWGGRARSSPMSTT